MGDSRGEVTQGDPTHGRRRFFKYASASTAIKILEAGTVRYSSPLLFNDPFDIQSGLHFDFEVDSLPQKVFRRIEDLVASSTKPNVDADDPFGQAILFMWERRAAQGFSREAIWRVSEPLLSRLKDEIVRLQTKYQQTWDEFLPRIRLFSVAEEPDNLLMWSHYALFHTGAVFEFLMLPDEDNALCAARPVIYRSAPLPFFSEQQWLDDILSVRRIDPNEIYWQYAYVKSEVWSYEKEWRVWDLLPQQGETLFSEYSLRPNEVAAVYLGCMMKPSCKAPIKALLSQNYPRAILFEARKAAGKFELQFHSPHN